MGGILYGIGVGPGDPELMTLKAIRTIERCPVVAVPDSGAKEIVAWKIAAEVVDLGEKQRLLLPAPMTRDQERLAAAQQTAAEMVAQQLAAGQDVAFLTLGDVSIYSTYYPLYQKVSEMGFQTKMIPGVPSFCAAAAALGQMLVDGAQPLHLLPASHPDYEAGLALPGTKVLMKSGRALGQVYQRLAQRGLLEKASLVCNCGMEDERLYPDITQADLDAGYFSIVLVKED